MASQLRPTWRRQASTSSGVVDLREGQPPNIEARGRRSRVESVAINGRVTPCDLVVMSGSPQPNYKLLAQAGARVVYDGARGVFVPTDLPPDVEAVGAAAGDVGEPAVPDPVLGYQGDKCFVCFCEDQTTKDLKYAIAEGFDSIELSKRYTTVTMGPCQGRLCHVNSIRVYAKATGLDENTIGTTTARPPHSPITLGLLAGPPAGAGEADVAASPPRGARRHDDVDGRLEAPALLRARRRGRGEARPRGRRADRRLDPRQDPRHGPRCGGVPRPRLPEPLLRPQGRAHPLRGAHGRRGPDHGRRDRGAPRRRDVLRDDDVDRCGRRLPVVHVVERGVVHGRPVRPAHRIRRRGERRRPAGSRADDARVERRLLERGPRVPRRAARAGRRRALPRAPDRLRRGARLRAPLPERARRARLGRASRARRGPRRGALRPRAAADPPAREGPRDRQPGHRLRVEPPRGGDAVAREERQGLRVGRQVGDPAGRRSRSQVDARRIREPERRDAGRGRAGGRRRRLRRTRDVRAALGRARQGDRSRDRPQRARGRGSAVRRPGRRPARSRCASISGRSSIPLERGSRHERRPRLPLAVARPGRGWLPPRGALRGRAALPRGGRDVRGARRLARPHPGAGRGRASRPGRDRRSVAPRHARRPPGAARRPGGRRRHDVPSLAEARARRSTRSPRARPSGSRSPATRSSPT